MKIYKRQTGGVVYNPFIGNAASPQAVTQPTNEKDDSGDEIQKAIIKVLEQNGVPTDVNAFLAQAKKLIAKRDFSLFSTGSDSYDMSDLIRLHSLANQIKWNSESANQAETQIINERAGSDVAINSDGNMYIWDDETKGIKLISPNTYAKNRSQYRPLTNNDLLYLRESMPGLAFKNEIFIDLKNVVGINSIVDYIKGVISSFGTETFKNNQNSYTIKHKGQIEKGFESILGGAAPDGIYKVKNKTETSDQGYNDEKSLLAAAQYLWSTLNPNMKNTLIAHTAAEGLDPNNPLDRYRLLITAIQEHTTHSRSYDTDVDYDATASKAGGLGSESTGTPTQEVFGHRILKNQGNFRPSYLMLDGSKVQNILPTYHYNTIQDKDKQQVPNVTLLSETYRNLQNHGIVDTRRSAYFGSLPIESIAEAGNKILINNNDDGVNVVYMPIDAIGNIDMGIFTKMMNIQKSIQEQRITDTSVIQKIWEENGFDYNAELGIGQPKNYTLAPYWMQSAYTSTSQDLFDKSDLNTSSLISIVDKSVVENLSNQYNMDPLHSKNKKIEIESGFLGTDYQAMIYIPLSSDEGEALFAGGASYIPKIMSDNLHAEMQAYQRAGLYNPQTNQYSHIQSYTGNELD